MDMLPRTLPGCRRLELLDGPRIVIDGEEAPIPEDSLRLLAYLALQARSVPRKQVAGSLWPQATDQRAGGNLRSALWRLRVAGIDFVNAERDSLSLQRDVVVDVHVLKGWTERLIQRRAHDTDLAVPAVSSRVMTLLAGWYEDWIILERERLRCMVLHALEIVSELLSATGRHAEAIDAALTAICAEPLRESAQRALISAHAAEGNLIEANRALELYADLLRRELAVEPSSDLIALASERRASRPSRRQGDEHHDRDDQTGAAARGRERLRDRWAGSPSLLEFEH